MTVLKQKGKISVNNTRKSFAQVLDRSSLFLLANLLVLLLVRRGFQPLPWQTSSQEVHENVTQSFQVISPGLLPAQVGVDTHVAGCTGQRLSLTIRDVLLRFWITVLLGHTKVDDMNDVGGLGIRAADEEVVGLDITVDQIFLVNRLDARELKITVRHYAYKIVGTRTICLATITTVFVEKRRLQ